MTIGLITDTVWIARRDELVRRYWSNYQRTCWPWHFHETDVDEIACEVQQKADVIDYAKSLPYVHLSTCPICHEPSYQQIDLQGLDGMYWHDQAIFHPKYKACPHFGGLAGAIQLHGRSPDECAHVGGVYATIGPARPYVIPDTLAGDDVVAVVNSTTGPHDDTYYMMAYYAPKGLEPSRRPPSWGRRVVVIHDEVSGRQLWTINNSRWDFDLEPYVDRGQLMWIPEGKDIPTGVGHCPFIGLPGNDRRQEIECCLTLDPEDYLERDDHYDAQGVNPRVTALTTRIVEHYTPDGSNPNPFA